MAAALGHYYIVKSLLNEGANPNVSDAKGFSPLHFSAQNGDARAVQLLVDFGASTEVINRQMRTPVMNAIAFGHIDTVRTLLDNGAKLDRIDLFGLTSLEIARQSGFENIVELLNKASKK